jgi:hypothetical protein
MAKNTAKKTTANKASKSTAPTKDAETKKIDALMAELKPLEDQVDFEYPEEKTVESLTELLEEVKATLADDEDEETVGDEEGGEGEGDESDDEETDESDDEDADAEDDEFDGDPNVARPTALNKDEIDAIEEEVGDIKGDAICIVEGNQLIRTYYDATHSEEGSSFKDKAEGFVTKRTAQHAEKDNGKKCKAVDANTIKQVYTVFRRETGKGDNRRVELQRVEFSLKNNGKTFKEQAHALALKVANTPGQDGPGVVVLS